MEDHYAVWGKTDGSNAVPLFGFQYEAGVEPVNVNVDRMISTFRQGLSDLGQSGIKSLRPGPGKACGRWEPVPCRTFALQTACGLGLCMTRCRLPHRVFLPRDHVLIRHSPLYLGRTASFCVGYPG